MSDPLPDKGSSYNTTPRERRRKKFNPFAIPTEAEGFYSPFWPLLVVFLAFIILLVYEISFLRYRTMGLRTQYTRLAGAVQKANAQTEFIKGLHTDLETLAPGHPDVALLLKEFFPSDTSSTPAAAGVPEGIPDTSKDTPPAK